MRKDFAHILSIHASDGLLKKACMYIQFRTSQTQTSFDAETYHAVNLILLCLTLACFRLVATDVNNGLVVEKISKLLALPSAVFTFLKHFPLKKQFWLPAGYGAFICS